MLADLEAADPGALAECRGMRLEDVASGGCELRGGASCEGGCTRLGIYEKACASCHGAAGEGNGARAIPKIAGQHAGYVSRQMYDAVDGRRPQLTRTHRARLAKLDFAEVRGLADFISRIGWHGQESSTAAEPPPAP